MDELLKAQIEDTILLHNPYDSESIDFICSHIKSVRFPATPYIKNTLG